MCNQETLKAIIKDVCDIAASFFSKNLKQVLLFGSYAKGTFDDESDVDFMLITALENEEVAKIEAALVERVYDLSLQYDIVVSINIQNEVIFQHLKNVNPFYRNVAEEGIKCIAQHGVV